MISTEFLQIAEGLIHLDPIRSYPERGAQLLANLVNASAYHLEFQKGDTKKKYDSTPPPPTNSAVLSLPLRHGRRTLGTIDLFLPEEKGKPEGQDLKLARWGARALARGLTYTARMSKSEKGRRMAPEVRNRLDQTPLTRREKQVVALLVAGASTRSIAEQSNLTVATVHTYLKRIYSKLGVHSRVELVARIAGTEGSMLPPPPPLPAEAGEIPTEPFGPN